MKEISELLSTVDLKIKSVNPDKNNVGVWDFSIKPMLQEINDALIQNMEKISQEEGKDLIVDLKSIIDSFESLLAVDDFLEFSAKVEKSRFKAFGYVAD